MYEQFLWKLPSCIKSRYRTVLRINSERIYAHWSFIAPLSSEGENDASNRPVPATEDIKDEEVPIAKKKLDYRSTNTNREPEYNCSVTPGLYLIHLE